MTISVIMVVENGAAFLAAALDSIARNRVEGMEVIIFDGNSTDGTAEIAAAHPLRPTIRKQRRKGHGPALNQAVAETRGEWLAFIDCDDVWPDGRLPALFRHAVDGVEWIYGKVTNCDAALRPAMEPQLARLITASLIRRSAFAKIGAFRTDITHGSNIDFVARSTGLGIHFQTIEDVVLLRRVHANNMGVTGREKARVDLFRILRDHKARQLP